MLLYYFTSAAFGIQNIANRRLKIAKINELNDPFEFLGLALKDSDERHAFRAWKKDMSNRFGLICMSPRWQHPLMWSHYAEKHKGVCLGFDVDADLFGKINYTSRRISKEFLGIKSLKDLNETHVRKIVFTKYSSWKYEAEQRAYIKFDTPTPAPLEFLSFSPKMVLRKVIVGSESDLTRGEIQDAIRGLTDIETFKARPAFKSFSVIKNRNSSLWV